MRVVSSVGELRERVAIQTNTPAPDAVNQPIPSWATTTTIWAWVEALTGKELESAQRIASDASIEVICRYRTDFTVKQRLLWRGEFYNIRAIVPYSAKDYMAILASRQK